MGLLSAMHHVMMPEIFLVVKFLGTHGAPEFHVGGQMDLVVVFREPVERQYRGLGNSSAGGGQIVNTKRHGERIRRQVGSNELYGRLIINGDTFQDLVVSRGLNLKGKTTQKNT